MLEEKVTVVKMLIAKLAGKVPTGYSKSTDKISEHFKAQGNSEVNQFFSQDNTDIGKRRYLDPEKILTKMKAEEEDEEEKKAAEEENKDAAKEESKEEKKDGEGNSEETKALGQEGEEQERKEIA